MHARVLAYYPFGPTIGAALNATLISYVDRCNVGLNLAAGAVPHSDELVAHIQAGFDEVLAIGRRPATTSAADG